MDQAGNTFFAISPVANPNLRSTPDAYSNAASPAPLADTFKLHSRPSATKVIYLDFNGHTTSGTAWKGGATFDTPEYNVDANPGFGDAELRNIQNIWARVVEDFSPFDVNVTTEEPALEDLRKLGAGDDRWGIRVVIGPDAANVAPGAGGVAYVGSFNWTSDTPTFVFNDRLGNDNKNIAEAISHEVGHTLGLVHDGRISPSEAYYYGHSTGPTGWAPIMGVGYYKDLVQWSKGEYASANNQEDDLSIITTQNGFSYRPDDYGSTLATATTPTVADGTSISLAGVIERTTDVDVFRFFTLSTLQATILPATISPNLDILAEIWDASGTVLFTNNPVDALTASFSRTVSAGWYYLALHGTGKGDPLTTGYTDYASLGQYTVSMTVASDNTPPAPPKITALLDNKIPITGSISNGGKTDDDTPTISGTSEVASTVGVFAGATLLGTVITAADGKWSLNLGPLSEGTYTLTAVATDLAGNTGLASVPFAVTIDITPPAIPAITVVTDDVDPTKGSVINGGKTNDPTPMISGTAPALTAVSLFSGGTLLGQTTSDVNGNWSITPTLADATYTLSARTTDDVGNASDASAVRTLTVDTFTANPTITSVTSGGAELPSGNATNKTVLVFNGTAEAGSLVTLRANSVLIGTATVANDGTWSLTSSALAPSATPYIFTATAVDNAGNPSGGSSAPFSTLIDLTPPDAPLIQGVLDDEGTITGSIINGGRTNDATPTVTGTAEPSSTVTVYAGATELGFADVDADGKWSLTLDPQADGTYLLRAVARDAAGNDSELSAPAFAITIDQTPPAAPAITGVNDDQAPITGNVSANGSTNDTRLVLSGTADPGMTVRVTAGATLIGTTAAGNDGKWSLTTGTLAEAVYDLKVTAIDDVGNSADSATYTVTVDTSAPAPVIATLTDDFGEVRGAVSKDGVTDDATLVISGTSEPGSVITVRSGGFLIGSATANASGNWSVNTSALAAGVYTFTATQVDRAGNTSAASPGFGVTLDLIAPATPAITGITDDKEPGVGNVAPGGTTNDNQLVISGLADTGSTVRIFDGGSFLGTATAAADGKWSFATATLTAGVRSFTAVARDAAGNESPASAPAYTVTVKLSAAAPVISGATDDTTPLTGNVLSGGSTNDTQLLLAGTADVGSTVTVSSGTTPIGTAIANASGVWQLLTSTLSVGTHSLTAVAVDLAGNVSPASTAYAVTVDLTKPNRPTITAVTDDVEPAIGNVAVNGFTNDTLPIVSGTAEPGSTVTLRNNGVFVSTAITNSLGNWTIPLTTPLSDNTSPKFTVFATDAAGNESDLSAEYGIRIDTTPPGVPVITKVIDDVNAPNSNVADNGTTDDPRPEIQGTAEPNARISILLNDTEVGSVLADNSGAWSFTPAAPLDDGVYAITAVATDSAGNKGALSAARGLRVVTSIGRPLITGIFDNEGAKQGLVPSGTGTDDSSPVIRGTAMPGSTVNVTVRKASDASVVETAAATIDLLGQWSFTPNTTLQAGTYEITAVATDSVGNVSLPSSPPYVFMVDFTPPDTPSILGFTDDVGLITGDLSSGTRSNDAQPTLFGKAEAGASVRVFLNGSPIGSTIANAQGDWRFTTSALPEGNHSFTARAIDSAGWQSGFSTPAFELTVDLTPLGVPTITGAQDDVDPQQGTVANNGRTNDRKPTLEGTAAGNARVEIRRGGAAFGTTTSDGSGKWAFTPTADLDEGAHSFTAFSVDDAGNASAESPAISLTIDTATTRPVITSFIDDLDSKTGAIADGGLTNDPTPTLSGTAEPSSTVRVYAGATELGSAVAGTDGKWSLPITSPLTPGLLSLTAASTDPAGNVSLVSATYSVTLDTQIAKPAITNVVDDVGNTKGPVAENGLTDDSALTISGTADPGSTVSLRATPDGGTAILLGSAVADTNGAWTFNSSALPDGRYTLAATATDVAGNTSDPSDPRSVRIDTSTTRPFITAVEDDTDEIKGMVPNGGRTNDAQLKISGTAEAGSTVVVRSGATQVATATAAADGAWTATTSILADGTHVLTAIATDPTGNQSAASPTHTVIVDATKPAKASISTATDDVGSITGVVASGGRTNDRQLTLAGTAEAGATVMVKAGAQTVGTTTADASGKWSLTTSDLPEETLNLTASATDAAGNVGDDSNSYTVTIDLTAPGAPTALTVKAGNPAATVPANGRTKDPNVKISGTTATPLSTVTVRNNTTVVGTATADAGGDWSLDAVLADGTYNLVATASDDVGNESSPSPGYPIVVDATAPAKPRINGVGDDQSPVIGNVPNGGRTNDRALVLSGTAEPSSTVEVFDGVSSLGQVSVSATGAWTFTTAVLAIGDHSFTARATDAAGNVGDFSAAYSVAVDLAEPNAPVITAINDDFGVVPNAKGTRDRTLAVSGTAEAGSAIVLYRNSNVPFGTATAGADGKWTVFTSALADGEYVFSAKASDQAGNESSASTTYTITVDTVVSAPSIAQVADDATPSTGNVPSGGVTNDAMPTIQGTAEANSTVTVRNGSTTLGTVTADGSGSWSFTPSPALPDGTYAITATVTDIAGNVSSASAAYNVRIDTSSARPVITGAVAQGKSIDNNGATKGTAITVSGTAEPDAIVTLRDGSTVMGTAIVGQTGAWSLSLSGLSDKTYTLTAKAVDQAGNESDTSLDFVVLIDNDPPAKPAITGVFDDRNSGSLLPVGKGDTTADDSLVISGTADPGSTVTVKYGTLILGTRVAGADGKWSLTTSVLPQGTIAFTAVTSDLAGNESQPSDSYSVKVDSIAPNKPTITGPVAAGGLTKVTTPTFTGAAETGSSVVVTIKQGTTTVQTLAAVIATAGAYSATPTTALADGSYTVTAIATDAFGNASVVSDAYAFSVDTTKPVAPAFTKGADNVGTASDIASGGRTNDTTLTLSGTAETGSSVVVTIKQGTTTVQTLAAVVAMNGAFSATPTALADGTYSATAVATDAAGNASDASTEFTFTVDTTPDGQVTNLVVEDKAANPAASVTNGGLTKVAALTISGNAPNGSKVNVFDGQTQIGTNIAVNTGAWSLPFFFADGAHSLTAVAVDDVGNAAAATSPFNFNVDTLAPGKPTITLATDNQGAVTGNVANGGVTDDSSILLSGTADIGTTVVVALNGTDLPTTAVAVGGAWSLAVTLSAGLNTFTARAIDTAGNSSPSSDAYAITLDTSGPNQPTISGVTDNVGVVSTVSSGGRTNDTTPTITVTAPDAAAVRIIVRSNNTVVQTIPASLANGSWSATTAALVDGTYGLTAIASDAAGNESIESAVHTIIVDTMVATPSIVSVTDDVGSLKGLIPSGGLTDDALLVVVGSAEAGSTVELFHGNVKLGTATADNSGSWTLTTPSLPSGTYGLTAIATDPAGNASPASVAHTVVVDLVAPGKPTIDSVIDDAGSLRGPLASGAFTDDNTLAISGSAEPGTVVVIWSNGIVIATTTANASGSWTTTTPLLAQAGYALVATARDPAGNDSVLSAAFNLTIDRAPPLAPVMTGIIDDIGSVQGKVANGGQTDDAALMIQGDAEPGSVVAVTIRDNATSQIVQTLTATNVDGKWSATAVLPQGTYAFTARATDAAGNESGLSAPPYVVTVDLTPPAAPAIGLVTAAAPLPPQSVANGGSIGAGLLSISGTAAPFVNVTIAAGQQTLGQTTADATGKWTFQTPALSDGGYSLTAIASDSAGNISPAGATPFAVAIDTVAPSLVSLTAAATGVVRAGDVVGLTATLSEPVQAGSSIIVTLDMGNVVPLVAAQAGTTLTGSFVVQPGQSSTNLRATDIKSGGAKDLAGNGLNALGAPQNALGTNPIVVDAAIKASAAGFSVDPTVVMDKRVAVRSIPITFSTPVSGFSLANLRLTVNGRSVSLRGARLQGSGANYVLLLPARTTKLNGIYSLQVGGQGPAIRAIANGEDLTTPSSIYWGKGKSIGIAQVTAKAAAFATAATPKPAAKPRAAAFRTFR